MMSKGGIPYYTLKFEGKTVLKESRLGVRVKDDPGFVENMAETVNRVYTGFDETWQPVLGEVKEIRNRYNEMKVTLQQIDTKKPVVIVFRLFNDGLGFRYEFPETENQRYFTIMGEMTEFALNGDHKAFWIPGDFDSNEYPYATSKLSGIDAEMGKDFFEISTRRLIAANSVQSPLMMKSDDGLYINIFEASVVDYPVMHLLVERENYSVTTTFSPDAVGNVAWMQAPCATPWRTVIVTKTAEEMLAHRNGQAV